MGDVDYIDSIEATVGCHLAMIGHARADYPCECCGILVGRRVSGRVFVDRVVAADNITVGDPVTSYQVDWKTFFSTRRELREGAGSIVGFYHSHTDGTCLPSRRDVDLAWGGYVYLIVPVGRVEVGRVGGWYARGGVEFERVEAVGTAALDLR